MPADASASTCRGKTIIPGLIDAHWHGAMGEDGLIPQQSWINYASLAFGVTTLARPVQPQPARSSRRPRCSAPASSPARASTRHRHHPVRRQDAGSAVINSLDDALTHLVRLKAAGAISVKSYQQPRRDQRQQVIEAARRPA
jgi:hypothetical protein